MQCLAFNSIGILNSPKFIKFLTVVSFCFLTTSILLGQTTCIENPTSSAMYEFTNLGCCGDVTLPTYDLDADGTPEIGFFSPNECTICADSDQFLIAIQSTGASFQSYADGITISRTDLSPTDGGIDSRNSVVVFELSGSSSLGYAVIDDGMLTHMGTTTDDSLTWDAIGCPASFVDPSAIPTMGQWSLFILGLLFSVIGLVFLYNRHLQQV